mgnify:FL=1
MTLFDVAPAQSSRDEANHGRSNAETLREMTLRVALCETCANFFDVRIGELRTPVSGAERLPALRYHVSSVLGIRAEKEMRRIDAGRMVAPVANTHACWDLTHEERVGDAMRSLGLHVRAPASGKGTVSIIKQATDPNKASARRDRLRKQPEHGVRSVMIPLSQVSLLSGSLVRPGCDVSGIVPGRIYSISGG